MNKSLWPRRHDISYSRDRPISSTPMRSNWCYTSGGPSNPKLLVGRVSIHACLSANKSHLSLKSWIFENGDMDCKKVHMSPILHTNIHEPYTEPCKILKPPGDLIRHPTCDWSTEIARSGWWGRSQGWPEITRDLKTQSPTSALPISHHLPVNPDWASSKDIEHILNNLFKHEYWSRLWPVQEILLAQNLVI